MSTGGNKKFLFYLGHPAHFHNVKELSGRLRKRGDQVFFIARNKDVLFQLLEHSEVPISYLRKKKTNGLIGQIRFILYRCRRMSQIIKTIKPDILIGTDIVISWIGRMQKIPSVIMNEDDLDQVPLMAYGMRFCDSILAPVGCRVGRFESKLTAYKGIQESAYLHPSIFKSNGVDDLDLKEPFAILRFASLDAHHDKGRKGIDNQKAMRLIELITQKWNVYITSERPLSQELEQYRIQVDPARMHDVLMAAKIYIGDSQTMTAEAALLGTPSLRYNDFVGKLSYLEMLENRFGLTKGFESGRFEDLIKEVERQIYCERAEADFQKKKEEFFNSTDEVNGLWMDHFDSILQR